ncbi:peptidoglycan DD-metalloendopeptidase family protein [Streptomyces sp. OF8]|uniref:Peptidoglycan DD-metalloendopeptidase family protein n=2 Tax=Streptomyces alkaliterrae TaxID=2213162 RepID=A0A7W3ZUA1_9ACTN|nr:peptidoglycan DD-metalloendopeptidase family protein [Streptomyces alkaliterrae]
MCGIVGYIGKRDVAPLLLEGLQRLEYRGYDSAGIAIHAHSHGRSRRGLLLRGGALLAGLVPAVAAGRAVGWPSGGPGGVPEEVPAGLWTRPLTAGSPVSASYGIKGDWLAGYHTGVDFAVDTGTRVYSIGPGTIEIAGEYGDYGEAVLIRLDDGYFALYAHLSTIDVKRDRRVDGGERLGETGATGRVTGPHLHFEVRATRNYGSDVDPVEYLATRGVRMD